jgi:hypothetical protein
MVKFLDLSGWTHKKLWNLAHTEDKERLATIDRESKDNYTKEEVLNVVPMTFLEEFTCVLLFLFGVPGAAFSFPVLLGLVGYLTGNYRLVFTVATIIGVTLSLWPVKFNEESLSSWSSLQILRYFSFKAIYPERLPKDRPYILVAPPHGVFPFGNIATMIAFPSVAGYSFRALAATAAMRAPVFRQLLGTCGAVDASRETATETLKQGLTIGISSGGVAEVFETENDNEVIVLKNRQGIIKLAFATGTAIVPCYLLGNTSLLSSFCWGKPSSPSHQFMKWLSRKTGKSSCFSLFQCVMLLL